MDTQNTLDTLADTLFELMENISEVEESLEATKKEVETIKATIDEKISTLKTQGSTKTNTQSKKVDSDLAKRFKKLEANVNLIAKSGALEVLSKKIDKKMIIKQEIRRYQFIMIFILLLVAGGGVTFFYFNLATSYENLIAFGVIILAFLIALFVINNNLKLAITEEKHTRAGISNADEIAFESQTLDMPDMDNLHTDNFSHTPKASAQPAQHREREIRNTFDD